MGWSAQRTLALIAYLSAVAIALWAAYSFAGWHTAFDLVSPPFLLPVVFLLHLASHTRAVWLTWSEQRFRLLMWSNAALLAAILLRIDLADYPGGWFLIQGIVQIPPFLNLMTNNSTYVLVMLYDWALLSLPAASWVLMLRPEASTPILPSETPSDGKD